MSTVLIDLDHTLLNTNALKIALAESLNLTMQAWEAAYSAFVKDYGTFNPEDFLKGVTNAEREQFYNVVHHMKRWLYPDSLTFLEQCVRDGWQVVILTFGNAVWQKLKLSHLALPAQVKLEVTEGQKIAILEQYLGDVTVMIDDKASELDAIHQQFPQVQLYWMRRPNTPYHDIQPNYVDKILTDLTIQL